MKITRSLIVTGTTALLALGSVAALAPSASAADGASATGCSKEERMALRQEITDLHTQINALRLSPQEIADAKAARQAAIADLRASYGLPGATLTDAQRAELRAKTQALKDQDKQGKSERRAKIEPLKAQIVADRSTLSACRAASPSAS